MHSMNILHKILLFRNGRRNIMNKYLVMFGGGSFRKMEGNSLADAFCRAGLVKPDEKDIPNFSSMETFEKIQAGENPQQEEESYQLFIIEKPGKPSRPEGKPTNNLPALNAKLDMLVKRNGNFSGFILDLVHGGKMSWIWR